MKKRSIYKILATLLMSGAVFAAPIDPAIDDAPGPFCYFSRPSFYFTVADHDDGTQVTPEGWLWTGSAQMLFFAGADLAPLRERIQTLREPGVPVVVQTSRIGDIVYEITRFGATLDGNPQSALVNFIRVRMKNEGKQPGEATFAVAVRGKGDHCCERLTTAWNPVAAQYEMGANCAVRDGNLLYMFPVDPPPKRFVVPDAENSGPVKALDEYVGLAEPVCMVRYGLDLKPGEEKALEFKMPFKPVSVKDQKTVDALAGASFDKYLKQTEKWWHEFHANGMQIELPETKVTDTFQASIMFDTMAREKIGDDYIVTVTHLNYHDYYLRDGAYITHALDLTGRRQWVEQGLEYMLKRHEPDGRIVEKPAWDGYGQAMWAFGAHWRLTGDNEWARNVYPNLARHVRAVFAQVATDPLGLVPVAPPYDNEGINGHYTGHSFWMLIGMADMIAMAEALGEKADAEQFKQWRDDYKANFTKALDAATAKTGGYIPPGLDADNGNDWDNLISLYPQGGVPAKGALDPADPRIGKTLDMVRKNQYREGIMTYGRGLKAGALHHYLTFKATEGLVALNRQREALEDLYGVLAHTSSTGAGFEFKPGADGVWGNRDTEGNYPCHGWFAAEYIGLLRNLLVRESAGDLHLFSVLSPEWVKPGSRIAVRNAPTDFGMISVVAEIKDRAMTVNLDTQWRTPPRSLIMHLPWYLDGAAATVDGKPAVISKPPYGEGQQIVLPPKARTVTVQWKPAGLPELSFANTVAQWKKQNRQHYDEYVAQGGKPELLWKEPALAMTRAERQKGWIAEKGIAVGCKTAASGFEEGHQPENAADGRVHRPTEWSVKTAPAWWQVDLGKAQLIDSVRVISAWEPNKEKLSWQYKVLVSTDGSQWQTVSDYSNNQKTETSKGTLHTFQPVSARYVRVEMLGNSKKIPASSLNEVKVFPAMPPAAEF
ncbi:MAG TPA: discoidin domain-containing protein [Pontiellaceae bacterium]|nr:discoidin domain-containing protein [Pontiellaceae bacterium]